MVCMVLPSCWNTPMNRIYKEMDWSWARPPMPLASNILTLFYYGLEVMPFISQDSPDQCPMPINADQDSGIIPNVDQFRSMPRHFGSMP